MLPRIDHYAPLLRAVARLDRASYEARGAIYDRALTALVERLNAADPPHSQAEFDKELLAFRAAVRRLEFGDMDEQDRIAQQGRSDRAQYLASRRESRPAPDQASLPNSRPSDGDVRHATASESTPVSPVPVLPPTPSSGPAQGAAGLAGTPRRRSVLGRVAGRMVLPVALVVLGLAGYAYDAGRIDSSLWEPFLNRIAPVAWRWPSESAPEPTEPATYYEQTSHNTPWQELAGSAHWRTRIDDTSSGPRKPATVVLTLDFVVPERGLSTTMAIRRDGSEDAAITHLIEFAFSDRQGVPIDTITEVTNVVMKQVDGSSSRALAGRSIKVAPGLFLFGLSGEKEDVRRNAESLRVLSRMDIPVSFANGSMAIISVNKGVSGERAFNEALADWAR